MTSSATDTALGAASGSSDRGTHALARAAVEAIAGALEQLRDLPWWRLTDDDLLTAVREVEATLRSGFGVQMRLASEVAERGVAQAHGERSAAHLLAHTLRIPVGQARARVTAARMGLPAETLTGDEVAPEMPELAVAVDSGTISDEHAAVVTSAVAKIPDAVDPETRAMCREVLMSQALVRNPVELRKVAEQIRLICDPDGAISGKDCTDRMELHFGLRRSDGLAPVRGLLDPLTMEQLQTAVQELATPQPIDENTPDNRPAELRRAHALAEVLSRYHSCRATHPGGPASGGAPRAQLSVTISAAELAAVAGRVVFRGGAGIRGGAGFRGGAGIRGGAGFSDGAAPGRDVSSPGTGAGTGPGTGPGTGTETGPGVGAAGASLGTGVGQFGYGMPASLATARLLACDGLLVPQLVGDESAVLDQGRGMRLFSREQRRALTTRDKGCAFPGCDIPAAWCEAHHITYWSHGGPTDLANGVLLCRRHHTVIHQEHWQIRTADTARGRPWFIPPKHIDPEQQPRQNHHFHLPVLRAAVMRT